jgi:hypothetical protein
MSYVEHCKKHGYGEICGECFEEDGIQKLLLTEQVTSLVSENLNLHEGNTRLNDSIAVIYLENSRLEAENKLLREALQSIVNSGPASPGDKKHEIAKAALEDKYESA